MQSGQNFADTLRLKDGVPCMTYYDLDNEGYRTATTTWKVQL